MTNGAQTGGSNLRRTEVMRYTQALCFWVYIRVCRVGARHATCADQKVWGAHLHTLPGESAEIPHVWLSAILS
eukprot:34548-Eustigmatos_ZCMA.PRE.1